MLGKPIDNSRVVRQVDPRSRREIWLLILLVAVLAAGLGSLRLARPRDPPRRAGGGASSTARRSGSLEENRKLRLEKAALENLRRVETIATRDLGLAAPAPSGRSWSRSRSRCRRARRSPTRTPRAARPGAGASAEARP